MSNLIIVDESKIQKKKHLSRWLIGPWNSPSKIDFGIAFFQPDQKSKPHYHEVVEEIIYSIDGEITLILEDAKSHKLKAGFVVFLPPKQIHALHNQSNKVTKLAIIKSPSFPTDKIELETDQT